MLSDASLTEGAFVAVDIETTGCMPGKNGIMEIGAARIEAGRIVDVFSELVSPGEPIPYSIQLLTGITDRVLAAAPPIAGVFASFREFAADAVLIAHNYRFDLGFLDYHAELATGEPFPRPVLDTLSLAKRLFPELGKYNLGLLASTLGVPTTPSHRAASDAQATAEIFLAMSPALSELGLATAGDVARFCGLAGQESLAGKLVMTTTLPDDPGVYILRDSRSRVIYVGRAKNLRVRLRSYFYVNSDASGPRLGDETVSIRHIPCDSPLDAVLLQSRLVHRYRPKHNVAGQRGDSTSLITIDASAAFPALKISATSSPRRTAFGPFVSRWAVESVVDLLREVYGLRRCARRITSRASETACAFRDEGVCPRPCVGGIEPGEYHERLSAALAVFNGSSDDIRARLEERTEEATRSGTQDDVIRYRDALKALDRALSGLAVVRRATSRFGMVILEPENGTIALHLVRHGFLVKTLRLTKADCAESDFEKRMRRALRRAFYAGPYSDDPVRYTPRQLKDVFLIESHREQHSPAEVEVTDEPAATLSAVMAAVRRHMRITRRRHLATAAS